LAGVPIEDYTFTFTTAAAAGAPTVVFQTPAVGATDVDVASDVKLTFSEQITGWGGSNATLTEVGGAEVPITKGFFSGNRLFLNPHGADPEMLKPGTEYQVTLIGGPGGIRSLAGVPIEDYTFTFTTAAAAGAPTVVSQTPEVGATDVAIGSDVKLTFSEQITGWAGSNATLTEVGGAEVPITKGFFSGNRLFLNPYGADPEMLKPGTEYQVTLIGGPGGIRSLAGVPIQDYTFTFTTAP
jgi:methionine-rich copper-binding protein CopC